MAQVVIQDQPAMLLLYCLRWISAGHEFFQSWPDFIHRQIPKASGNRETAIIRTRLVWTSLAFDQFCLGMQWGKPLVHRRTVQREGWHSADGGQVAGAGAVADEGAGLINEGEQFCDCPWAGHDGVIVLLPPPVQLARVANNLYLVATGPQSPGDLAEMIQRPNPGR